ncbi:antirestriction protein ArdA, partial [Escherichia coli]|nr:antirestriction protein ArdA [Escherichia coli]
NCDRRWMPNHDRFECQTAIDSDAILHHINWAWFEGFRRARDEGCEEAYRLWVDDTGETDFDTFRDAWWGEADSEEAFAVEFASDTGLLADVPETVALYFDYEAYARDLFLDSFTFIDGHVFRR